MIGKATSPDNAVNRPQRLTKVPGDLEEPEDHPAGCHRCNFAVVIAMVAFLSCALGAIIGAGATVRMLPATSNTNHPPTSTASSTTLAIRGRIPSLPSTTHPPGSSRVPSLPSTTQPLPQRALLCPEYVLVSGIPSTESKRNGLYRQLGIIKEEGTIMNGGRPTFKRDNKPTQFLFYHARLKSWRIGNQPEAGQDGSSDGVISQDWEAAVCPTNASGWHYWKRNRGWVPSPSIKVEAASKDGLLSNGP